MRIPHKAVERIKSAKDIAIGCHVNPDGDTIGSLLSLGLGLKKMGKKVYLLSQDGVPKRYRFLPGSRGVRRALNKKVDLAISVDCGTKKILGKTAGAFNRAQNIIEIDHHEFRKPFGNIKLVDTKAAAAGEIVYRLLRDLGVEIDKDIAMNILTAVIVETNSFRLPNVSHSIFDLCSKMMKTGVNFYELTDKVYWSKTREIALLTGITLSRCRFEENGRLVWSLVRKQDFKRVKGKDEDIDALADEMRSIKDTEVVVLFRERGEKSIRVSLRSKNGINVAQLAERFGGGGHSDVAGCTIDNSIESIHNFLSLSKELLKNHKR